MRPHGNQLIAELYHCDSTWLNDPAELEQLLTEACRHCGIEQKVVTSHHFEPLGVTVISIVSESHIALHTYPEACHVSVDIFTCSGDSGLSKQVLNILELRLKPKTSRMMGITRGNPLAVDETNWITTFSGYGFETRYHIKKRIFSRKLTHQTIDIIDNENFGRMLFLDNELQIAQADADLYHNQVIAPLVNEGVPLGHVAILGGGDGGLLSEILTHNPGFVTVIEIEKDIPQLAETYLECICHDAFKHPRVKIIYADAQAYLTMTDEFDAIIYDLTMHPSSMTRMDRQTFLDRIFRRVNNALKKGGVLSLQCCPEYDEETFAVLKPVLLNHFTDVKFHKSFIPSFSEKLIFAHGKK